MSEQLFKIVFAGELREGQDETETRARLAALFKSDEKRVAQLFNGKRHAVKRNADAGTAERYVQALAKAGAIAYAEPVAGAATTAQTPTPAEKANPETTPPQAVPTAAPQQVTDSGPEEFDIAPVGSDLINDDERQHAEPVQVETNHLEMASIFKTDILETPPPPPPPDTSHIDLSEIGADLNPDADPGPDPVVPDISAISLADPGGLLVEPAAAIPVSVPDTSSITLAPPGTELEELREEREPINPDISGLSLTPENDQESAGS